MAFFFSMIMVSAACYFLGSVPFGLLIGKYFCGIDPRTSGSCNVGATNVSRLCGFKWGAATLLCDLLKGFVPVFLLTTSGGNIQGLAYPAGLALILGHMYSFFLQYKGGKGVATTVGVFLALAPLQFVIAGICCLAVIYKSGYVSAGSLVLVSVLPFCFLVFGRLGEMFFALIIAAFVIYAHRENIRRLLRGEEKSWMKKKDA